MVSSLYELSKAATEASSAAVDFYNASLTTNEDATHVFTELADSLKLLTHAAHGVHLSAKTIIADNGLAAAVADPALLAAVAGEQLAGSSQPKPLKKKVEKDPYAPKKPLTVFFAYSAYIREAIRDDRAMKGLSALSSTEITQEISRKWNEMSDLDKEKWKEAYAVELSAYQQQKEKYLQDKKNGVQMNEIITHAPVPVPAFLEKHHHLHHHHHDDMDMKKRPLDEEDVLDHELTEHDKKKEQEQAELQAKKKKRVQDSLGMHGHTDF